MKRLCRRIILALPFAATVMVVPARADFYKIEGRFQCLETPGAVCTDATPSAVEPPPDAREAPRESGGAAAPDDMQSAVPVPPRPVDPILAIAARIREQRSEAGDLAVLRRAAATSDPRALELLAWCVLRGIGTSSDPVAAYFLYGEAAARDVPHARENQALIYERSLTPDQRQRVLEIEAEPRPARRAPGALSAADFAPGFVNELANDMKGARNVP